MVLMARSRSAVFAKASSAAICHPLHTHRAFSFDLHGRSRDTSRQRSIRVMEVSPRDGLQNEARMLPAETKVDLIRRLLELKLKAVEVGSFVSPKWVPQMASTPQVMKHPALTDFGNMAGLSLTTLVPNLKGFDAFQETKHSLESGIAPLFNEMALFASATEGFSKANLNSTISESLKRMSLVAERATEKSIKVRGYVSCAFGCPYQGLVDFDQVVSVSKELLDMGCYEVAVSDTIGVGVPRQVEECLEKLNQSGIPSDRLGIHCHDTFGTGLANALAAAKLGVQTVDSSVGGIGGCPYSPGATGNIATEDLVYALELSGYSTGLIDPSPNSPYDHVHVLSQLEPLARLGDWINAQLGRTNSSRVGAAILARRLRTRKDGKGT